MDHNQRERIKYSIEGAVFGLSPYLISELSLSLNFFAKSLSWKDEGYYGVNKETLSKEFKDLKQMRNFIKPSAFLCPAAGAIAAYALHPRTLVNTHEIKSEGRLLESPSHFLHF